MPYIYKVKLISTLFFGVLMFSCKNGNETINEEYFTDNCIVYSHENIIPTDTLSADIVMSERMGVNDIMIADSIICLGVKGSKYAFELYNLQGDSLISICSKGSGPNDVGNTIPNSMTFDDDSGFGFWIVDQINAKLKRVNLAKSLEENTGVIDVAQTIKPMVKFAANLGDSLIQEEMSPSNMCLTISESADCSNVISSKPLYNIDFDNGGGFMAYNSPMAISDDCQNLVIAMGAINQINILNLKDKSRLSVSLGNVKKRDQILLEGAPRNIFYTGVCISDDNIIALNSNMSAENMEKEERPIADLHVIDMGGKA